MEEVGILPLLEKDWREDIRGRLEVVYEGLGIVSSTGLLIKDEEGKMSGFVENLDVKMILLCCMMAINSVIKPPVDPIEKSE